MSSDAASEVRCGHNIYSGLCVQKSDDLIDICIVDRNRQLTVCHSECYSLHIGNFTLDKVDVVTILECKAQGF